MLDGAKEVRQNDMMETITTEAKPAIRWSHVVWIILATIILTVGATYWALRTYIYAKDFKPVVLKQKETVVLDKKLKQLGFSKGKPRCPLGADK